MRGPDRPGCRPPDELRETIQALLAEVDGVPVPRQPMTVWEETRLVHSVFAPRQLELSKEALDAMMMH